ATTKSRLGGATGQARLCESSNGGMGTARLICHKRTQRTRSREAASELREAYGVRPACGRFPRGLVGQKARASSIPSIGFSTAGTRKRPRGPGGGWTLG